MRAALISGVLMLVPSMASAGPKAKVLAAVRKAGFVHATVVATGTVWAVNAEDRDGQGHVLLVDPARRKVLDGGESALRGSQGDSDPPTVSVAPFLGEKSLWDVVVSSRWSNGMGGGSTEEHYIVRRKKFTLACEFSGSGDSYMEESSSSTTVTVERTGQHPLTWTVTTKDVSNRHGGGGGGIGEPDGQVVTLQLGASGRCQGI